MIFDRTQNDVNTALSIRMEKVQTFSELTDSDIEKLERGLLTINTLNRIEEKQNELKGLLNDMGYWSTPVINKAWTYTDIFNEEDFQRIIDNTNTLRSAFFVRTDTPATPPISFHYENINSLEKILFDLDVMINDVKSNYRECGTFESGEEE